MKLSEVLFLGGRSTLASVQVRCVDIARKLGCDYLLNVRNLKEVPERYSAFVCIKPDVGLEGLERLSRHGKIIWDIIDGAAPREHVSLYLASTQITKKLFSHFGKIEVIPHHHCNFTGVPNPANLRQPVWLGSKHWEPRLPGFSYKVFHVNTMSQAAVIAAYRRTGIALNFRNQSDFVEKAYPALLAPVGSAKERRRLKRDLHRFHLAVNSGIKLINCLGFGIPSVSAEEPAYAELGEGYTLFSSPGNCAKKVALLKKDRGLYAYLRENCLRAGLQYHIDVVADRYERLLGGL